MFVALVPGALSIPTVVSFLALGFALVLSIWKPWGRTRWAQSAQRGTMHE